MSCNFVTYFFLQTEDFQAFNKQEILDLPGVAGLYGLTGREVYVADARFSFDVKDL